ncbi:MAG: sodium:solute symporter [Planctomycetota bacterium]
MRTADWIVAGGFLGVMVIIAIRMASRVNSTDDYFTAGRRVKRWLLILFAFGSGTSSDTQSSVMAGTWRSGLSGLWWQFLWLPITPFYWIVAPLLRRMRAVTTADFFEMRFGSAAAALYSAYGMVISVVLMAGILFGSARLLDTLTDPFLTQLAQVLNLQIPVVDLSVALSPPAPDRPPIIVWRFLAGENLAACCLALLMILIAGLGGLGATILIDGVQGLLRIGLTVLFFPMLYHQIGGLGAVRLQEALKPGMLDFVATSGAVVQGDHEPFTPFYLTTLAIAALAGVIVQPHVFAICSAGQTELDARIGFTFGNLLKRVFAVVWAFMALIAICWYLGPKSPLDSPQASAEQKLLAAELRLVASGQLQEQTPDRVESLQSTNLEFSDRLFGRICRDLLQSLPAGVFGLSVSLVLLVVISHCGTQMVVGSGLFANSLYRHHIAPGRSSGHYLAVGRLCGPILVFTALLLQTTFTDLTDVLKLVIKTPAVIGMSMWMGLVWTRWNSAAVWATTLASAGLGVLCGFYPEEVQRSLPGLSDIMFTHDGGKLIMFDAWKIILILAGGLFCGIVAALLTDPQAEDQLEQFYKMLRTPVAPDEFQYADQYIPPETGPLAPAVSFLGFQFPGPTRSGTLGFIVAWLVVAAMVFVTKWASLRL